MCKCCSDHKGSKRDKLYEFLHGHTHDRHGDDPAHSHEHQNPHGHSDLEDHNVATAHTHPSKEKPHHEQE